MKLYDTIRQYEKDINKADAETRKIDDIDAKREAEIDCIIDSLKDIYGDQYNSNLAREVINQRYNCKRGIVAFHKYCFDICYYGDREFIGMLTYLALSINQLILFICMVVFISRLEMSSMIGIIITMGLNIIWYLIMIGKKWQCSDKDWYK